MRIPAMKIGMKSRDYDGYLEKFLEMGASCQSLCHQSWRNTTFPSLVNLKSTSNTRTPAAYCASNPSRQFSGVLGGDLLDAHSYKGGLRFQAYPREIHPALFPGFNPPATPRTPAAYCASNPSRQFSGVLPASCPGATPMPCIWRNF